MKEILILITLLFTFLFKCSSSGESVYSGCQEKCRYRYADCMDECKLDGIGFTYGWDSKGRSGLYICPDRCSKVNNACLNRCKLRIQKSY